MSIITAVSPVVTLRRDEVECVECGDWLPVSDAIYCRSCEVIPIPLCEDCYGEYNHWQHDTNPENDWLRGMIKGGVSGQEAN